MPLDEDTLQRFLARRRNAVIATNRRDGPPQLSTVWYRWTGEVFHISTQRDLHKTVNLRRDPRSRSASTIQRSSRASSWRAGQR
jgi:hypothetical protein